MSVTPLAGATDPTALTPALTAPDWKTRWQTCQTLGEIGDKRAVRALIRALDDSNQWVRIVAAEALGHVGDQRATQTLILALNDDSIWVRRAGVVALGQIGDKEAIPPLMNRLLDPPSNEWPEELRDAIAQALGAIGEVGRGGMVGCALGLQAACLEASVKFANERILYGKPISRMQTIQNKLADMKIDLEAGFLLGYRAAAMQDKGERCSNEFAAAKYFTTEAAQRAAKMAVDIHGGYGCMEEYAVSRYLRDAFVLGPSAGTSDIMKVIVARWALS